MSITSIAEALERRRAKEEGAADEEEVPKVHVDEIASKVAAFYERARNIIDYREEHLFRKRFIVRALKRRLALNSGKDMAERLVKDIVRAGHLPNDNIPETKIPEVGRLVETFRVVRDGLRGEALAERRALADWFFRITATAVEETLAPPVHERLLADFMTTTIRRNLTVRNANLDEARLSTGVFVGVEKALLRSDEDQLRLHLFRFMYPEYAGLDPDKADALSGALPEIERSVEKALADPKRPYFLNLANRWAPAFSILGDVIRTADRQGELPAMIQDRDQLEDLAQSAYRTRFRRSRSRLRRFAFFTVISFFISKIAVALAIEIPIQTYLLNDFSLPHTVANILFAPLLMLLIVAFIRMPSRKNQKLVVEEVSRLAFEESPREYQLVFPKKRGPLTDTAVRLFYVAMFFVSLFIISKVLLALEFNVADIVIFVLFTSLVGAAGVKVHHRAREISLERRKPKVIAFVLDVFAIPFITIGKWIIEGLSRFNIFVMAVDLLVDMPFHIFVEFLESFRDFVRGRKEAID